MIGKPLPTEFQGTKLIPRTSQFRLNNKKILVIYQGDIEKLALKEWILNLLFSKKDDTGCGNNPVTLEIAQETKGDILFTYLALATVRQFQATSRKILDYHDDDGKIHEALVYKFASETPWINMMKKLASIDPELSGLKNFGADKKGDWDYIMQQPTLYDACTQMEPRSVQDVVTVWHLKSQQIDAPPYTHYKWHDHFLYQLDYNTSSRTIIWYYDPIGNNGKTRIAMNLWGRYPGKVRVLGQWGSTSDFATTISTELSRGWSGEVLIVDIGRVTKVDQSFYACMESLSNRCISATKYHGGLSFLPVQPKIVVFSNVLPNIKCMSLDRWKDVYYIFDRDQEPKHMSLREIYNQRQRDWDNRDELPEGSLSDKQLEDALCQEDYARTVVRPSPPPVQTVYEWPNYQ